MTRPRNTDFAALFESLSVEDDGLPAQPIGEWTLNKLALLAYYLKPFAEICQANRQGWYYVDGFAGRGANRLSGAGRYKGTASIGLSTEPSPTLALLVERNPESARLLDIRARKFQPDDARRKVINLNFNEALPDLLKSLPEQSLPAFFMLDPFATELAWSSVASIATWRRHVWPYEQLIYFPTTAVERMGGVAHEPQRSQQEGRLDIFFGTSDWRAIATEQRAKRLLPGVAGTQYLELYRSRLESLGYLPVLSRWIQRSGGRRLYHLLFATGNSTGHKIMGDSLEAAFMSTLPLKLF